MHPQIDLSKVRTYSVQERANKVQMEAFGRAYAEQIVANSNALGATLEREGWALRKATPCFLSPAASDTPEADFLSRFFKRRFPCFVAQDDQVTAEERTEPATSGGSRPLQLRFPNCIERARKKLQ